MKLFRWLVLCLSIVLLAGVSLASPSSVNAAPSARLIRVKARAHRARHHKAHRAKHHRAHPART